MRKPFGWDLYSKTFICFSGNITGNKFESILISIILAGNKRVMHLNLISLIVKVFHNVKTK